jgi:hypothetical protein
MVHRRVHPPSGRGLRVVESSVDQGCGPSGPACRSAQPSGPLRGTPPGVPLTFRTDSRGSGHCAAVA